MSFTLRIEGMADLERKLNKLKDKDTAKGLMAAAANDLVDLTAPYPPAPPYGGGPGARWYERGRGGFWRRKDGSIGGPSPVSQDLIHQWKIEPMSATSTRIINRATYSGFVHDENKQVGFHAARGWLTIQGQWTKHKDSIIKKLADAVDALWRG